MASPNRSDSRHSRTWGLILLALGAFLLALSDDRVPERSSLTEISGQLRSLEKTTSRGGGLSSVRFSLSTDPRHFSFHSSAGLIDDVWNALNQAGHVEVGILIDPEDSHSPLFDDRSFYAVLEVRVGKKTIRSYPEVAESLRTNSFTGDVLGYGAAAMGVILLVAELLMRRRHV